MKFPFFRRRIRHPFFPGLTAAPAEEAQGRWQALAGTFGELARAAARGVRVRRAVYVLTGEGTFLSDGERDELWRLFEVPVYALVTKHSGRLVAWECEAQNGLHLAGDADENACACGRPGAKISLARPVADAAD